jgi:preprotein translocase subunit SecD
MRAFLFSLAAFTVMVTDGRSYTPPPALTFYIVNETKIEGSRFIDSLDLPKVGYVGAMPDLTVTRLESVTHTTSALSHTPALVVRMRPEDARKFTALTQRAIGKRVLMMLGERPLIAPFVREPIATKSIWITFNANDEIKEIEIANVLQKLVQ